MHMTQHASVRVQQRGIPPLLIDLLLDFGTSEPSGDGTSRLFFDKIARRRVTAYAGAIAKVLSEHMDVYAIVNQDERVITVGHRFDRIRRS